MEYIKNKLSILLLIVMIFGSITNCTKETEEAVTEPDLPPIESFVINTSDFQQKSDKGIVNWLTAAVQVGVWNTFITLNMIVPVASFQAAMSQERTKISDDTWAWEYSFTAVVEHSARLEAQVVGTEIHWSMYISKAGAFTDHLWYTGISNFDGKSGSWTVYYGPNAPQQGQLVKIEWYKNSDVDLGIKYTNVVEGGAENGGYISYGLVDEDLNAFYDIFNKGKDNLCEIKWNRTSKYGKIKDPINLKDENWHCWDENLQDVDCE